MANSQLHQPRDPMLHHYPLAQALASCLGLVMGPRLLLEQTQRKGPSRGQDARAWSFYILSRSSSDELGGTRLNAELFQQFGMLGSFLAEEGDQIETRG
ncbi:MAG TPA: hypothetical protein VKM93_12055, partial [Terriglobia bacterium]|nr:hypothetical protein [Terriglobia bacterium]